jgi:hypothetical protein
MKKFRLLKAKRDIITFKGDLKMLTTIEAEIDVDGSVRLLEPLKLKKKSRAIITLLDTLNADEKASDNSKSTEKIDWNDEAALRAAFAELEDDERELANVGLSDYAAALAEIDGE